MSLKARPFHPAAIALYPKSPDERDIRTIPQLVEFNSQHNPDHVFCIQARRQRSSISVSHFQLKQAILQCSDWLTANVKEAELPHHDTNGTLCRGPPIALAMDSDIGLLVHLLSLLSLGVPVLLLSARLSPSAIRHLIQETSAEAIIGALNYKTSIQEACITSEKVSLFTISLGVKHISLTTLSFRRWRQFRLRNLRNLDLPSISKNALSRSSKTSVPIRLEASVGSTIIWKTPTAMFSFSIHLGLLVCQNLSILRTDICLDLQPVTTFIDLAQVQAPNVSTLPLFHVSHSS